MGFWKSLKIWDTQAVIETTIETTQKSFLEAKRKFPDRDPHAWLALTFGSRSGYKVAPLIMFTRTTMFSVLGDDAPAGLAYYFLTQEMPAALPRFAAEMDRVIGPALDLIRQGAFAERWELTNPWTAANIPGMREVVPESTEAMAHQLAAV